MATLWTNPASAIPSEGVLTIDRPIEKIKRILAEIQARVPLRVTIDIAGLSATGKVVGNMLTLTGQVEGAATPGHSAAQEPLGGDDTREGDGKTPGGTTPPPPGTTGYTGTATLLDTLSIAFDVDGSSLLLTPTATTRTLTFKDGLLTSVSAATAYTMPPQRVNGVDCT